MRLLLAACLCLLPSSLLADEGIRLFILSGQSNMVGLKPEVSFTPAVKDAYAGEEVVVVKNASGGKPIRLWYKDWKAPEGKATAAFVPGSLYDSLMKDVNAATAGKKIKSVVFVWMQGERDAREGLASVYSASMQGLIKQLRTDLKREDIPVVIGRLSDYQNGEKNWDDLRAAQAEAADADPLTVLVDTDDLNGPKDGLHYNQEGYKEMGSRFAQAAITLLNQEKK
ncbi:sialate O-acetylesterase [Lignipirellula cremea]|nr:sialate O-acetylesterase [Lignipirellula cremea]